VPRQGQDHRIRKIQDHLLTLTIDPTKEYGIALEGGAARGAYEVGVWKALAEAGICIKGVAGTSIGALNGAFFCMDALEEAVGLWENLTFSHVIELDEDYLRALMNGEIKLGRKELLDLLGRIWERIKARGYNISPLKKLIAEHVDESMIRASGKDFFLVTFSLSDFKGLSLHISEIPNGKLGEFLLASAYLYGFQRERLDGKLYYDGSIMNNLPYDKLIDYNYKDIIEVRIYGHGRIKKVKIPEDVTVHVIEPRVSLGAMLNFDGKQSKRNITIGYYDGLRYLYGLIGHIYYLIESYDVNAYHAKLDRLEARDKAKLCLLVLKQAKASDKDIYLGLLEACAKVLHIQKYHLYTVSELEELVRQRYGKTEHTDEMPELLQSYIHLLGVEVFESSSFNSNK